MNAINNNSNRHILLFTPDESPEIVLAKLIAIRYSVPNDELERRVKAGDEEAIQLVHDTARIDFSRLIVIDAGLTIQEMQEALDEAEDYWSAACDLTVYDFLGLMPGGNDYTGMTTKVRALKSFAREGDMPLIALHHNKRDDEKRGQSQGLDGMAFGGEAEAMFVLEVYRKRENPKLSELERQYEHDSVTVEVIKNKRPRPRYGAVDLYMNEATGHLRTLTPDDRFRAGEPTKDAAVMLRARKDLK